MTVNIKENPDYTTKQLITYIGNKRSLVGPLEQSIQEVRSRLGGRRLRSLDLFAGSGFVSRLLKEHSSYVSANDLEDYSVAAGRCFLANKDDAIMDEVAEHVERLNAAALEGASRGGFIRELYSPRDDQNIQEGERVFYTNDNARRLDYFAQEIRELPEPICSLLLGPLLSKASVHVNTGGVFRGFYKDKHTGLGKFGGTAGGSLERMYAPIELEVPVLSNFSSESEVFQRDANELAGELRDLDLVYLDPPYNQHAYGANYFMLNLLANYERPEEITKVAGVPVDWNRSGFNVKKKSLPLLSELVKTLPARFLLVSFNSEGYIPTEDIRETLESHGRVDEEITKYSAYRASRNFKDRNPYVNEHLFLLDREG